MVKLLKKVLVIVLAGGKGERLEPLTRDRTKPAVPFGGIYRIIDFSLSNAINSNLRKVIVLVQYKCISLNRHIREGWNFLSSALGEYIEPISPQQRLTDSSKWYLGTADAVYQNIYSIEKEIPEYVLILAGDHVYKMDYNHIVRFHRDTNADITVSAIEVPYSSASLYGIMQMDSASRITNFREKPSGDDIMTCGPGICMASMGIYVFKTEVLYKVLAEDDQDKNSSHDFGRDIIPKALGKYNVHAFNFIDENKKESKYWRDVGTIDTYYQANMDLISVNPQLNIYDNEWPIHTAMPSLPPPKFVFSGGEEETRIGMALDSMISPGSIISGGKVQNSILSPNVRVNSYSSVMNSIIFENVVIGRHAKIKHAIIDKDVIIPKGAKIGYDLEEDQRRFTISPEGIVVISKGTVV